jgi:hypothetical protein
MDHSPLAPNGTFAREKRHFEAIERHFLQAPSMKELATPYLTMEGRTERPIVVIEKQPPKFTGGDDYERLAQQVGWVVREVLDKQSPDLLNVPVRDVEWALRKWLVSRDVDGEKTANETTAQSAQRRGRHKVSAEEATNALFERYKHTEGMRALFFEAEMRRCNRHDMCDALLMGMAYLLSLYAEYAQDVLGRRKPGEYRPKWPVLTAEQMHGGTFRGLFVDAGSANMGLCFLELVGMVQPPDGQTGVMAGFDSPHDSRDPEPRFRIFALENLNLTATNAWSPTRGQATVSYWRSVATAPVLEPDYFTTARPITAYFKAEPTAKRRRDDTDDDAQPPRKKKRVKRVADDAEAARK